MLVGNRKKLVISTGSVLLFGTSSQTAGNVDTVIGQTTHTLTANSHIKDMVLKSIIKELMGAKVAKENYKQKCQQAKKKCSICCYHSCCNRSDSSK